jgi:lipopolysaccharide/colanic/teichoic acid biosynthesis glycosyltransferase
MDICLSIPMMLVSLPVLLISILALVSSGVSPRKVFFIHERVGRNGQRFGCLKLRTMRDMSAQDFQSYLRLNPVAYKEWTKNRKLTNDPRVTRIGSWLRKTSLDEIPQLWNVFRGDMSLVGPRPVTVEELGNYGEYIHVYLSVKPGLTGLWQVSGRSDVSWPKRVEMDCHYARSRNMLMDILIILKTPLAVLKSRGAR